MIHEKPKNEIFASDAKAGEIVEFPNVKRGWGVTENLGFIPPMEYFNAAFNRIDKALAYQLQRGVGEWDKDMEYPIGAVVSLNGIIYIAKSQNTNKNPANEVEIWGIFATKDELNTKENKGVAKTLDDALKQEIAGNYLLKTGVATDSDKLDGLQGNEYHQRNSANPSKVTSVTGNIVDLSQGDNFTVSLSSSGMLTLTNPSVGQSGVLIVSGATNISGFSSNISFRIVPTGLNATETFAYFVQSKDVIKMGRV